MAINLSSVGLQYEDFAKVAKRISHNDIISDYYSRLSEEAQTTDELEVLFNRSRALDLCGKYLDFNYYRFQGVKVLKRVNSCRDKFCPQCQSLLAQTRLAKYSPVLDEYSKDYDLYHVVFSVPNCHPDKLKITIVKMYKAFAHMIRYFRGNLKIKCVDFEDFGFVGAVRSLEITQNFDTGELHPHFHCLFILRKGLDLQKTYINQFSFDKFNKKALRRFSRLEILLQKIWCLLFNGLKVTAESIEEIGEGYSVVADEAQCGDYKEIFKYALKGCCKGDQVFTYENFKALYYALHNRRILQGYGVLRCLKFENDEIFEDEVDSEFDEIINELEAFEKPVLIVESLTETMTELLRGNFRYISKANIRRVLREADTVYNKVPYAAGGATMDKQRRRE